MKRLHAFDVYVELGQKRVFAGAVEWPGWARSGKDEEAALKALVDYGPRYERSMRPAKSGFQPPADDSAFRIVERLKGDATTDFGSPGASPAADDRPLDQHGLERLVAILRAGWKAFDAAVHTAGDRTLRKGPRGGGRETEEIVRHVLEADAAYLGRIGQRAPQGDLRLIRKAMLDGLTASARGEVPVVGPRGGRRWTARYFVRRAAWHALDHAWEIEDRLA